MRARWRFPALVAVGVTAFVALAELISLPLHERRGGEVTAWINGLARLFELPGLMVAETFGARFRHQSGWGEWIVMLAATLPIYFGLSWYARRAWAPRKRRQPPTADAEPAVEPVEDADAPEVASPNYASPAGDPSDDRLLSRRGLFVMSRRAAMVGVAGTAAYSYASELRDVEVTRQTVSIRGLPEPLRGLRLVQLSDIHHGPWTSLEYVRRVVAMTNALNPDLVVLTGDYVHQSDVYIPPVVKELAELRGKIGVVGTLGNHDWWENGQLTIKEFARTPVKLIDNARLYVTGDRTLETSVGPSDERSALCVAGVGDLWEGPPEYEKALGGLPPAMPRVLLSHNPDVAEEPPLLQMAPRIDLMLSGHTHGGQISLPVVGTLVTPSKYGNRYVAGMVQGKLGPVYINRGIGTTIMPMRLGVRPEISVFELQPA